MLSSSSPARGSYDAGTEIAQSSRSKPLDSVHISVLQPRPAWVIEEWKNIVVPSNGVRVDVAVTCMSSKTSINAQSYYPTYEGAPSPTERRYPVHLFNLLQHVLVP
jgi:hypothetical protein